MHTVCWGTRVATAPTPIRNHNTARKPERGARVPQCDHRHDGRKDAAASPAAFRTAELELVEDVWRGEAQDLLTQIAQLQEENKQLMTNLSHKDVNFLEEEFQKHEGMSERERQVMKKLKEVVDKQRDEIRAKDRELGLKNEDVEALQQQQNRLMKINHDLRHRITVVEAQGKALIEQKVELEAYLQTKEQEMGALRTELGKLREKVQGEPSQNGEDIQVAWNPFKAGADESSGVAVLSVATGPTKVSRETGNWPPIRWMQQLLDTRSCMHLGVHFGNQSAELDGWKNPQALF
ncbi:RILP-like protein 1 [Varanus komodoensis]|uniref:RILP-like protein 1 n=1 Tax=Varanus komodoensis TaxID=61221 RepID=UPI001CF7E594|nr:RILP-like protein 1 [Varanus komodoensis]